jgi:O-antigen/teichoic acid export membrane protein
MELKRVFKDSLHLAAGKIGTVVISLVNMIILARILTTDQMGVYSLFLMIVNLALIVGLNWSETSVVRHGREEYINSKKINQSFWARIYIFVPVVIAISLIMLIFSRQITAYVGVDQGLIWTLILMFFLNGVLNLVTRIYQSTDQMKKSAYMMLLQKVFYLMCLGLLFLNIFKTSLTMTIILINVSFLLAILVNVFTFDFSKIMPYTFNKEYFKKIWSYSWPQLIGFPGLYIINYIDLFVIKKYMTLHDVGVYNVAYSGFTNITMLLMIVYTVFMPLIVEYKTTKKYHLIKEHLRKTPIFVMTWVGLVIVGVLASPYVIPLIFSEKYVEAIPAFNVLLIASIFYFASIYLMPIVNAFDLILYSQIFNLVKAGVNIAGDFILVPRIGIIGAAWGTLASYVVGLMLTIILLRIKRKTILGEIPDKPEKGAKKA